MADKNDRRKRRLPVIRTAFANFFHLADIHQIRLDFREYYGDRVSHPQDPKGILVTYGIGGVLVIATMTIVLAPFTLPFLFGYFVREMGHTIYADEPSTTLTDLFSPDRPAFVDPRSLAVDGLKFGGVMLIYALFVGSIGYTAIALIDLFRLSLSDPFIAAFVEGLLVSIFIAGFYVVPFLLARFAHTGTLGEAFALSLGDYWHGLFNWRYALEFFLGASVLAATIVVTAAIVSASLLFAALVAFPTAFVLLLQSMDHFARGYRASIGVDTTTVTVQADEYAVPFRDGSVMAPKRDRSVLVLGETGTGKTEAIKLLAGQLERDPGSPFVVFDYKEDYQEFYKDADTVRISLENSTENWNIFREAETEDEFEEIGRVLFKQAEQRSQELFFPQAARQLTVAILKYMQREYEDPSNKDLDAFLKLNNAVELHEVLTGHDDLRSAAATITPDAKRQSAGVFSHLQLTLQSIFTGDFREKGEFSIREYMANPDGRILILDFPINQGERVKPAFRLFIDWAIRSALTDTEQESYFLLDEFQAIPGLEGIERLVNAGRARNARAILGLQSKAQLDASYGEAESNAIVSGLAQEILMRPGDEASLDYIRNRIGRERRTRRVQGPASPFDQLLSGRKIVYNQVTSEEVHSISEAALQRFQTGEAIVLVEDGWQRGQLYQFSEVEHVIRTHPAFSDRTVDENVTIEADTDQHPGRPPKPDTEEGTPQELSADESDSAAVNDD